MKDIFRKKLVYAGLAIVGLCAIFLFSIDAPAQDAKKGNAGEAQAAEISQTSWTQRCSDLEGGKKYCEIFKKLVFAKNGERIAELAVGYPEGQKAARGVAILPLGILLNKSDGVQMQIDDQKPFTFQIRYCTNDGCFGYLNFNDAVLALMKKGKTADFSFFAATGKKVTVKLPLQGFSKALENIAPAG